jgi:hypothetical protein
MKRDRFIRIGLVAVIVLLLGNLFLMLERPSKAAAGAIQYQVVLAASRSNPTQQKLQSILNEQGKGGWEFVCESTIDEGVVLIFKK